MIGINKSRNIAFLSTYPPRECGLAIVGIIDMEKYEHQRGAFKLSQHAKAILGLPNGQSPTHKACGNDPIEGGKNDEESDCNHLFVSGYRRGSAH